MLTPSFEARQDNDSIILSIRVPFVKISEAEIDIDGTNFKFHCHPYFLWLQFSGELVEDGEEKAQYEVSTGNIVVTVSKNVKGEEFKNLDMLTTLLGGKKEVDLQSVATKPLIEVISDNESNSADSAYYSQDSRESECGANDDLFTVSKEKCTLKSADDGSNENDKDKNDEDVTVLLAGHYRYGFADQHTGVLAKLQDEIPSIIDCPDPDNMNNEERRFARSCQEQLNFDPEHYLADLMDGDCITNLLKYAFKPDTSFTDEEKATLKDLPNKEYIIDSKQERVLLLGLVDIIYAYAYDNRINEGDSNSESAWCIRKLSPTLSWFEKFTDDVQEVIFCLFRRSLCYPLYRNYELSVLVLRDTVDTFTNGKVCLLKCLLSVKKLLDSYEPYYILNNLYITDYCVWIQTVSPETISLLTAELEKVTIEKSNLDLELCELEEAAYLVLQEEEEGETSSSGSSDRETGSQTESSSESSEEKTSQPSSSKEEEEEPLAVTLDMERLCISKEMGEERSCS